jgi:branched-subunit amino acid transport protein
MNAAGTVIAALRSGSFITANRTRGYACLLLAGFTLAILWLVASAHGLSDYAGRPLGTDFSSFYAAGRLAAAGHSPYDQAALLAMEQSLFGPNTPYYAFAYPPTFLLLLAPLARLPYLAALALWQVGTLFFYLAGMMQLRRRWGAALPGGATFILAALAFSAVFVNLDHGQNGFLIAGLFAFALALLDTRPLVAGLCFGLLAFKPQLGILIPFALLAGGDIRAFIAATLTVLLMAVPAQLLFGGWPDFLAAAHFSRRAILDNGAVGYDKMVSVFAMMRLWHLPLALSYGVQALCTLTAIAGVVRMWHGPADPRRRYIALCLGALLATPFALDYDLMILAPAILLLASLGRDGRLHAFEASLGVLLWLMPMAARGLAHGNIPLAALAVSGGFLLSVQRGKSRV